LLIIIWLKVKRIKIILSWILVENIHVIVLHIIKIIVACTLIIIHDVNLIHITMVLSIWKNINTIIYVVLIIIIIAKYL
jgi:hypothetical protein